MKDSYYFPHDSNATDDPKIMMLIAEMGLEGYGIFWIVVEHLRNQPNYCSHIRVLKALAIRNQSSEEKFRAVVMRYELFIVNADEIFYSESLFRRMTPMEELRKKRSLAAKKANLIRWGSQTDRKTSQSKGKESKVKESKVKEIKEKNMQKQVLQVIPSLEEVILFFTENGYSKEAAEKAFNYYEQSRIDSGGRVWKDSQGNTVKNWKQKMRGVWFKPENMATTAAEKLYTYQEILTIHSDPRNPLQQTDFEADLSRVHPDTKKPFWKRKSK